MRFSLVAVIFVFVTKGDCLQVVSFSSNGIRNGGSRPKIKTAFLSSADTDTDLPQDILDLADSLNPVLDPPDSSPTAPQQPFERDKLWLENATMEMMDLGNFPMGSLTFDDVESISGLMAAWVRRKTVEASLIVEKLLKRVVDDMRADNRSICVSTRMYTMSMDAWAKSGAPQGAQRAAEIHSAMVTMYEASGDPSIAPSSISYNTLVNAWCKSSDPEAAKKAEAVLDEMIAKWKAGNEDLKPDAVTFSTLMDFYARSTDSSATVRAQELFDMMEELGVHRNVYAYSAIQNVYARSNMPDAPERTVEILRSMINLDKEGDFLAKPNVVNYNAVLNALSRTSREDCCDKAEQLLCRMELPVEEGGYDVEPDRLSYALTTLSAARSPDISKAADMSEAILERMETRAQQEQERREAISSAAPPLVSLDIESYNVVLTALSRCRSEDSFGRTISIIERMEKWAKEGHEHIRPNVRSWNSVLNALSRSNDPNACQRAEEILWSLSMPDAFSFAAVLSTYQKSSEAGAAQRADEILQKMEELYENGEIESPPDVYHYTIVCSAWAKSGDKVAIPRVVQILSHMQERHRAGYPEVKPNTRTFNAVLDCLSRGKEVEKAEQLLYHMLTRYNRGDTSAAPDSFSFNSVIYAWTRSKKRGSGRRSESIMERMLEYHRDENPAVRPDARSFSHIIGYYSRSKSPDAPYRAEYLLNRMVAMFKNGYEELAPTVYSVTTVMDAYAYSKNPDAGQAAERLIKLMHILREKYGATKFVENTMVVNSAIHAWSLSGHEDACERAEAWLDLMERKYESGAIELKPNTRTYGLVLSAWTKSTSPEKGKRALDVLHRMEVQLERGNKEVKPNEHANSLVINACAFTNGSVEEQEKAFDVALAIFNDMLESNNARPSSLTYGWFMQACARLKKSEASRDVHIERAIQICCQNGLVNDFVLARFRGSASDSLYKKFLAPVLTEDLLEASMERPRIILSQLPKAWTRNHFKRNRARGESKSPWWEEGAS